MTGATGVPQPPLTANYKLSTCTNSVSEGDLNTNPREISPDWGFHADHATPIKQTASPSPPADSRRSNITPTAANLQLCVPRSFILSRLVIVIAAWPLQLVWRSRSTLRRRGLEAAGLPAEPAI